MYHFFQPQGHLKHIRRWAQQRGVRFMIDGDSFQLHLSAPQRELVLFPRFSVRTSQGLAYSSHYQDSGFVGWVPYESKRWPLSTDKLAFKEYFLGCGLRVPPLVESFAANRHDYLVKARRGSFGQQVLGPFRPGNPAGGALEPRDGEFAERFIFGKAAKAWFWNAQMVAMEVVDPPHVVGDGRRTIAALLQTPRGSMDRAYAPEPAEPMLSWQGLTTSSIPVPGQRVWLAYKYATDFDRPTLLDRDVLERASDAVRAQLEQAGQVAYQAILPEVGPGCLYTLDAVIDDEENLWWLEMNSHPMVHPKSYPVMLEDCWGTS